MEMERSFYLVTVKRAYLDLQRNRTKRLESDVEELEDDTRQRVVVAITQGGFGQDVVDDEQQVKERFLEFLFSSSDIDLPRSVEIFDEYFVLEPADEFVDLDEEQ